MKLYTNRKISQTEKFDVKSPDLQSVILKVLHAEFNLIKKNQLGASNFNINVAGLLCSLNIQEHI